MENLKLVLLTVSLWENQHIKILYHVVLFSFATICDKIFGTKAVFKVGKEHQITNTAQAEAGKCNFYICLGMLSSV